MSCKCGSDRIVTIGGKTSDMFNMSLGGKHGYGYVPTNLFFGKGGYGDYINLDFCAECGMIQSKFPITESQLKTAMKELSVD